MFQGSIVAIVTPMLDDGAVDFDALKKLVKFHICLLYTSPSPRD